MASQESSTRPPLDWVRCLPFIAMHLAVISLYFVGFSWIALILALLIFAARIFGITAFYHRYFSHKAFQTSRWFQFVGAYLGNSAAQRGPIWWAAHHRDHHRHSDQPDDVHSPHQYGFFWSHLCWFMTKENYRTKVEAVKDLVKFPELRFLDRFDFVAPLSLAVATFLFGELVNWILPSWGTNGWQMLAWGFLASTLALYHATYAINSLAHRAGSRRFKTRDYSRNNLWLALVTFGEGWHNNHHRYPSSARQGFYWWEIDITYYILKCLSWMGLVWDLRPVPEHVLDEGRATRHAPLPD